jgi:hypothetical protein
MRRAKHVVGHLVSGESDRICDQLAQRHRVVDCRHIGHVSPFTKLVTSRLTSDAQERAQACLARAFSYDRRHRVVAHTSTSAADGDDEREHELQPGAIDPRNAAHVDRHRSPILERTLELLATLRE